MSAVLSSMQANPDRSALVAPSTQAGSGTHDGSARAPGQFQQILSRRSETAQAARAQSGRQIASDVFGTAQAVSMTDMAETLLFQRDAGQRVLSFAEGSMFGTRATTIAADATQTAPSGLPSRSGVAQRSARATPISRDADVISSTALRGWDDVLGRAASPRETAMIFGQVQGRGRGSPIVWPLPVTLSYARAPARSATPTSGGGASSVPSPQLARALALDAAASARRSVALTMNVAGGTLFITARVGRANTAQLSDLAGVFDSLARRHGVRIERLVINGLTQFA